MSSEAGPVLPRTLGLRDLVLLKVVAVVNISLVAPVAGYGRVAHALWIAAFFAFFIPEAVAVVTFARRYPGEGGIYLWTRREFGELHGFISGWCYWTNNLFYIPMQLVYIAGVAAFAGGASSSTLVHQKWYVSSVAFGWLALMAGLNILGLGAGKWIQNVGAIGTGLCVSLIMFAGFGSWTAGTALMPPPATAAGLELFTAFSVMCFTFVGFELASTMGDEMENPRRDLPRAILIAGAITLVSFIGVTAALQALVPAGEIDAIQAVMKAMANGAQALGAGWLVAPMALIVALSIGGGASAWFAGSSRVPFVAGLDHALPPALGRVHPRWGSPYVALLTNAGLSAVFIVFTLVGSSVGEAYQILLKAGVVIQLIPFGYMFAALMRLDGASPFARTAGLVGLLTSIIGIAAAFIPTGDVDSIMMFETKMLLGVVVPNLIGLALFVRSKRSAHAGLAAA